MSEEHRVFEETETSFNGDTLGGVILQHGRGGKVLHFQLIGRHDELTQAALSRSIKPETINKLLLALNIPVETVQSRVSSFSPTRSKSLMAELLEPLSERELQVLRLLDSAMTSEEIAGELFVSVHTIRTHIRNIYGKLDVHRRIEAIQKARNLGLI